MAKTAKKQSTTGKRPSKTVSKPASKSIVKTDESKPSAPLEFRAQLLELVSQQIAPLDVTQTLLCPPKYLPACDGSPISKELEQFIRIRPDSYQRLLSMIMLGSSVPTVALLCGIPRNRLNAWRRQGVNDQAQSLDTFAARFVADVNYAVCVPTVEAEAYLAKKDPLSWLQIGPGRWVNPEGTWQSKIPTVQEPVPESVGTAEPEQINIDDGDFDIIGPTIDDLPDALQVLRECGLGYVIEDAIEKKSTPSTEANDVRPIEET